MHSTHRRGHVRAGFGAVEEILKVAHQVVLVVGRSLSVHADSSVLAGLGIRHVHPIDVDVMRQRREGHLRAVPGEFRDPLLFREHGGRSRCTCHVSLQRFIRGVPFPPQGPSGWFPWLDGTMRRCDSLPPISPHFVSFAWRYHRCVPRSSPPAPDTEPWINLELVSRVSGRHCSMETAGSPKFPGNPRDHSPCSSDPGVTRQAEWTMG